MSKRQWIEIWKDVYKYTDRNDVKRETTMDLVEVMDMGSYTLVRNTKCVGEELDGITLAVIPCPLHEMVAREDQGRPGDAPTCPAEKIQAVAEGIRDGELSTDAPYAQHLREGGWTVVCHHGDDSPAMWCPPGKTCGEVADSKLRALYDAGARWKAQKWWEFHQMASGNNWGQLGTTYQALTWLKEQPTS